MKPAPCRKNTKEVNTMEKRGNLSIDSENIFPIIKKWLYSDHDIFYRELISNGCDAITKLKKLALVGEAELPEDYQRSLAAQYAAAGADLVIGMHPHVLQGIELIDDTPVFYSLGNFIFGGRTYDTAAVEVEAYPDGTSEVRVIPCMAGGGRTVRAEGEDALRIFGTINSVSFGAVLDENGVLRY